MILALKQQKHISVKYYVLAILPGKLGSSVSDSEAQFLSPIQISSRLGTVYKSGLPRMVVC